MTPMLRLSHVPRALAASATRAANVTRAASAALAALAACAQPAPVRTASAATTASTATAPTTAAAAPVPNARPAAASAAAAPAADAQGWVALFDGTPASLAANWRGYRKDAVPAGWRVEAGGEAGGVLALVPGPPETHGDLATREQYGDFELEYAWRVPPGANSGVMWRVSEDQPFPWQTGPEQQVLDDARHPDGRTPSHRAGALYDLVVPPAGLARPVGEFNQARVVARGSRVQLFLNGRPTADVDFASDSGRALVAASKFKAMPGFARNARGHIVLQDHGDRVWFRDVRVRRLDGPS